MCRMKNICENDVGADWLTWIGRGTGSGCEVDEDRLDGVHDVKCAELMER